MKQFVIYTLVLCMGMITGLQGLMIPVDREPGQPIYKGVLSGIDPFSLRRVVDTTIENQILNNKLRKRQ